MPTLKDLKNLIPLFREPSEQEKLDAFNEKIGTIGPIETRPTADLAYREDKLLRERNSPNKGPYQRLVDAGEWRFMLEPELFERKLQRIRRGEDEEFNKEMAPSIKRIREIEAETLPVNNSKFKKTKDTLKK